MTSTDRAFIDAYRRTTPTPASDGDSATRAARPGGPHFSPARRGTPATASSEAPRRAPLSQLIAERRENAKMATDPPRRSLANFTWPEVPKAFAERHPRPLLDVLTALGESVVTLVGARAGVGATTVALALGRAASTAGLRVAIVDCNPVAADLAHAVGAGRLSTLAEAVERGALATNAAAVREERVSIAVGGGPISAGGARRQLATLAEANDLVVVDGGAVDTGSVEPPTSWARAANSVTLVAATDADLETSRALRALEAARIAVNGVILNMTSA